MKETILILLFTIGLTLISCEKCPDVNPFFQINSLNSLNLEFTNEGSNPWIALAENDTVPWENYFNRVSFNCDYIATNRKSYYCNALYALSCHSEGYDGSKIGVQDIHFITLFDYNSQFAENDTIDSIVNVNDWTYSISDFSGFISIDDYVEQNQNSIQNQYFEFKILSPPLDPFQSGQFKIIYQLANGTIFEVVTEEMVLSL